MTYRFDLPANVENQIYDCALYIAQDNPERAITWVDEVIATMRSICDSPLALPIHEKLTAQVGQAIHHRPLGNYRIFYRVDIDRKALQIHLFTHAARKL